MTRVRREEQNAAIRYFYRDLNIPTPSTNKYPCQSIQSVDVNEWVGLHMPHLPNPT